MDWIAEMNGRMIRAGYAGGQRQASRWVDWIAEMNGRMATYGWVGWRAETDKQMGGLDC